MRLEGHELAGDDGIDEAGLDDLAGMGAVRELRSTASRMSAGTWPAGGSRTRVSS